MTKTANSPNSPNLIHVIAHTHWDREWYQPFQHFRMRLVRMMDKLLDLLERQPSYRHFNLDGQTIVLQDYLEIRPDRQGLLEDLVKGGRLGIGPWYILPDEFLVSGESLVRNLLLGHRIAQSFGHTQKVGYIPDTFGHIGQMPQILMGFGIDNAMLFRGLDEGNLKSEIWWMAPDGSRVLLRHLPTYAGYVNAAPLPADPDQAVNDLLALAREEARRATTQVLLAMNGVDHMEARTDLSDLIDMANQRTPASIFVHSSLETYFQDLHAAVADKELQIISGEIRDANRTPGQNMRVLPNILSSRIHNKLQNHRAQALLEHWAEPWSTLLAIAGHEYPANLLWKAWEWLLKNHPHDSIGGCSVDEVHAEMETRFAWATEIAELITLERFHLLAQDIDLSEIGDGEVALILFNGLPWPWRDATTLDVEIPETLLQRLALADTPKRPVELTADVSHPEIFKWRTLAEWEGDPPLLPDMQFRGLRVRPLGSKEDIEIQLEGESHETVVKPLVPGPAATQNVWRSQLTIEANVPAFGYQVFAVRPSRKPNRKSAMRRPHDVLENDFLHVKINPNGALTLTDKTTAQVYNDLGYFEDGGDCGDGYNYSYPTYDEIYTTLGQAPTIVNLTDGPLVQRRRIDFAWSLPAALTESRRKRERTTKLCPLRVEVSLTKNSRRLELRIEFDNRVLDHRLRMIFPTDVPSDIVHSEGQFDVVERPIRPQPVSDAAWVEDPPVTYPQQSWVDIWHGTRGLCIANQGLPEFEVMDTPRRDIAITLLRANGWLGAGPEIQTAMSGAGPHMPTPGAQIQRVISYKLAIIPHGGAWDEDEIWREAHAFNTHPRSISLKASAPGSLPRSLSLLRLDGPNVILDALKQSEDGEAFIVRLHNPTSSSTEATLTMKSVPKQVTIVGLDEKPLQQHAERAVMMPEGNVIITLPAKRIVSLKIWSE